MKISTRWVTATVWALVVALPTAVAGIALSSLYAPNGWLGAPLMSLGIKAAYTPLGIVIALTFIGLPFVVRTLQPVLSDLSRDHEEAAATLGASRFQTFRRVVGRTPTGSLISGPLVVLLVISDIVVVSTNL